MVGLVDEWAARFFEELDYVNEGENGTIFAELMRKDLPQVSLISSNIVLLYTPLPPISIHARKQTYTTVLTK